MSKFSYNISSLSDQKGESQIMIRVYVSREQRFRVKSGIYVESKRWGKKNEINIPLVDSPEREGLLEKRAKLKALIDYLEDAILNMTNRDLITKEWIEKRVDLFHKPVRKKKEKETAPPETFFTFFDEYLNVHKLSEVRRKNFRVLYRSLQRYEVYKRITGSRKFELMFDYLTPDTLSNIEDFISNEPAMFTKYPEIYHIHPKIVERIKEANVDFKNDFKEICKELDAEMFFYDGSDCVFPGVRRNINKEKVKNWKNNICLVDNMILNDNTFPRHIWVFLSMNKQYDGNSWKDSRLEQFELAHIFGHKVDEKELEKKVFNQYDETKLPYALFTSASNVVLIPNGLMKPTDKFESIKIAFYKRHIDLYGNNLYSEKDLKEEFVPKWYSEIEWKEPVLPYKWEKKIDNLLEYRKKYLNNKFKTNH